LEDYTNTRIDGRYEVQELIGVGGMACVYKAYDNLDERIVAVKILKDEYLTNEDFRQRFKNESKVIAVLNHPNIVKVYDVSYGDRLQYIVMEYIEGITLKEYIRQQGRLQPREVIHFTGQILHALQHAHDKGIVHRDIKPQNILLLADGTIKVTDFGIARFSSGWTKTVTDSAIGSVHYISPEQARGDSTDDKADIYSMGIVLYEMLTGSLPFEHENSVSVAMMQIQNDPTPPTKINPDIPIGLEQMTLHAMRKNPKERYQSAAEMILDLEELRRNPAVTFDYGYSVDDAPTKHIVGGKVAEEPAAEEAEEEAVPNRTVPILAGVLGAVVLVALIFVGIYAWMNANKVAVPSFLGLVYSEDIEPELDNKYKDFSIVTEEGVNTEYTTPGQVFKQSITANTRVSKGTVITLTLVKDNTVGTVTIPEGLVGMTLSKAEETLKQNNIKYMSLPITGNDKDSGKVTRTDPAPGTEMSADSTVQIYYVFNGETKAVPDLVRSTDALTLEEAKYQLEKDGFTLDEKNIKYADSTIQKDRVIAQSPAAGEKQPAGTAVKVTLSTGNAPQSDLTINLTLPNRSGLDGAFKVYLNNELVSGSQKTLLLDGSPYSYTLTASGTNKKVTVKINDWLMYSATVDFTKVPAVVTDETRADPNDYNLYLPNVVGMSEAEGLSLIAGAGFVSTPSISRREVSDPAEDGLILEQTPKSGATNVFTNYYPANYAISLVVGHYTAPIAPTTTTTTPAPTTTPEESQSSSAPASSASSTTPQDGLDAGQGQ
jgi:serine/threonine-protein kinase